MNGIHDLGGMHGFGAVEPEPDEPVFHADWEARFLGLAMAHTLPVHVNDDNWRYTIECLPPELYLSHGYYERWYHAEALQLVDAGMVTIAELCSGRAEKGFSHRDDALRPQQVDAAIREGGEGIRELEHPPAFAIGTRVRTRNLDPPGHCRLPRYARNRCGLVGAFRGAQVFPDSNALTQSDNPQHVYSIEFSARELWGPNRSSLDKVYLDLWESYLEPA